MHSHNYTYAYSFFIFYGEFHFLASRPNVVEFASTT